MRGDCRKEYRTLDIGRFVDGGSIAISLSKAEHGQACLLLSWATTLESQTWRSVGNRPEEDDLI